MTFSISSFAEPARLYENVGSYRDSVTEMDWQTAAETDASIWHRHRGDPDQSETNSEVDQQNLSAVNEDSQESEYFPEVRKCGDSFVQSYLCALKNCVRPSVSDLSKWSSIIISKHYSLELEQIWIVHIKTNLFVIFNSYSIINHTFIQIRPFVQANVLEIWIKRAKVELFCWKSSSKCYIIDKFD